MMIKRITMILSALIMAFSFFMYGCKAIEKKYVSGKYIGESEGYYSKVVVEVEFDDYNIISIEVLEDEEPPILADIVFEKLPPKIIKKNDADVDVIAGATYTSRALLNAVEKAIEQSRRLLDETSN